jgi:nicotinamidase-related amidase
MENNIKDTALLVMDMQMGILVNLPDTTELISHVKKAIATARNHKLPVIYVTVGFRPGLPEFSPNNKGFASRREHFASVNMDEFMTVSPALGKLAEEIQIIKRRISAFTGSDLEVVLRAHGVKHIVLSGVSTSGVVLSTTREAADKDYRITILSDCCADPDPEVHRVLTTKIFSRQADVLTVEEWGKLI